MYQTLADLARDKDLFAAIEHIQSAGSPAEVAAAYETAHLDAYWKHKDLRMVVALTQAGIHYCLTQAHRAADPATTAALRSVAKGLAYNLASFTWPGWDEPGIAPAPTDVALGYEAAKLNLRLALELQKPPDKVRGAHWLLGAHLLAAGQLSQALPEFRRSLPPQDDPDHALYQGYILLTQLLLDPAEFTDPWNAHLKILETRNSDEAKFARDQLAIAYRVFTRK